MDVVYTTTDNDNEFDVSWDEQLMQKKLKILF